MFKKIPRTRLYEVVAEEMEKAILDGAYEIGSRLPSEQSLANQFEVSRNVVREALKVLQERGLVQVLDGSGAFVARPNPEQTTNALGRYIRMIGVTSALDALYETRIAIEGMNARLAAERATEEQIQELDDILEVMRQNIGSHEMWTRADLDFHISIARATNNPFQALLLEPIVDEMREVISEGFVKPGATHSGLESHEKLMKNIKDRNPEEAYRTMTAHLQESIQSVKENIKENQNQ